MKIVHYDSNRRHLMPISGQHVICICGKWFQENYIPDQNRYTTDLEKVTCKNCLKKLKKDNKIYDKKRILIFTGDGKGKTTSAIGLAIRALGNDMSFFIFQFIKKDISGEAKFINSLPSLGVSISQYGLGFVPKKDNPRFELHKKAAIECLNYARDAIYSNWFDVIILDEICNAIQLGLIPEDDVLDILQKPDLKCHLVLTGRGASEKLIEFADTVTEMKCIKHGYDKGIKATKGIEY